MAASLGVMEALVRSGPVDYPTCCAERAGGPGVAPQVDERARGQSNRDEERQGQGAIGVE